MPPTAPPPEPGHDARIVCLYCSRSYRALGRHLQAGHQTDLATYRRVFGLADDVPLIAAGPRPGWNRSGEALGRRARAAAAELRGDLDRQARDRGYTDLLALLQATTDLTNEQLSAAMGWGPSKGKFWRSRLGVRSTAKSAAAARRRTSAIQQPGPAGPLTTTHPTSTTGELVCLECASAWSNLGKHVEESHHLSQDEYRRRHRLAAGCLLITPEVARSYQQSLALAVTAHAASRRENTRQLYDVRAQQAGFSTIAELVARPTSEIAFLLQVSAAQARRLRNRYLPR